MKGVAATVLAFFVMSALFGCKGKPTLIGHWNGNMQLGTMTVDMDLTFAKDGTLAFKQTAAGQAATQKGPYKELEKLFTFTPISIESPAMTDEQAKQASTQLSAAKRELTFDLVWKDADHISIAQQGAAPPLNQAIALTRKPS